MLSATGITLNKDNSTTLQWLLTDVHLNIATSKIQKQRGTIFYLQIIVRQLYQRRYFKVVHIEKTRRSNAIKSEKDILRKKLVSFNR